MMVSITLEDGSVVEGQSVEEATKAARKAQRAQARLRKAVEADAKIARLVAEAEIGRMCRIADGRSDYYWVTPRGHEWFCGRVRSDGDYQFLKLHHYDADAQEIGWYATIDAYAEHASGGIWAVRLTDPSTGGTSWHAVGAYGKAHASFPMPDRICNGLETTYQGALQAIGS